MRCEVLPMMSSYHLSANRPHDLHMQYDAQVVQYCTGGAPGGAVLHWDPLLYCNAAALQYTNCL